MYISPFPKKVNVGDSVIWSVDGFTFKAEIVLDEHAYPDNFECYTPSDIERWVKKEWFFCGMVVSVSRKGWVLSESLWSLWAIECNITDDNKYLSDVLNAAIYETLELAQDELAQARQALM